MSDFIGIRRVLVTGASGFIGRALVNAMHGHPEVELHSVSRGPLELGTQHHRCDLMNGRDVDALMESVRPNLIIHSAWYAEHGKFWNAEENLPWVGATLSLLRSFRQAGGERFVGVGTCAEYAWGGSEDLDEQDSALAPYSLYGVSKDATRRILQSFAEGAGLSWAWARLFTMYGPGEAPSRLFPSIALPLLRSSAAHSTAGEQLRDFLHVDDVASGIAHVALSNFSGPINVASGTATSVGKFATEVAQATGWPEGLKVGALPMRPDDPMRIVADTSRLRSLGFRPVFDLSAGIASAVEGLRAGLSKS